MELEEWVYTTRELLAARVRNALLSLAEQEASEGNLEDAARRAEAAYTLTAAPALEPDELSRIHMLLLLGNSAHISKVRAEAESYGTIPTLTAREAGAQLREHAKPPQIPNNLPARGTTFVGRELEITELSEMLHKDACRLVTLVGQGGMGKTRLALQVAQDQLAQGHFTDGVYFVALETLTTASTIPSKTAEAVGLKLQGQDDPLTQLWRYLRNKRMLLVLDNYEHLLEALSG